MAGIPGTNVVAPIVPLDTADVHPTHAAAYGLGGYRTVATNTDRDAIPTPRREEGMLVFVTATGKVWRLGADLATWTEQTSASTWAGITGKPSTFAPSAHAATHGSGGADPITVTQAQVTSTLGTANLQGDITQLSTIVSTLGTAAGYDVPGNGENASGSMVVIATDTRLTNARTPTSHSHGNVTNAGAIGTTSGQIVVTTTGGVLTTAATIAAGSVSGLATVATSGSASDLGSGTLPVARLSLVSPPAIGGTTPAAGTFTTLVSTGRLNAPSGAGGSPAARDVYAVADTLRYRDSGNVERLLLNNADNLANLGNTATARTNLGLAAVASSGSAADLTSGTLPETRLPNLVILHPFLLAGM